jgi:uncharacterized protein
MNFFRLASLILVTFLAGCITDNQSTSNSSASTNQADKIPAELEWDCVEGDSQSCFDLATIYRDGTQVERDQIKAMEYYGKACDAGNTEGCIIAADNYEHAAKSINMDEAVSSIAFSLARVYYEKACEGGSGGGCYNAGVFYRTGQGVGADIVKAEVLFKKGCDLLYEASCQASKGSELSSNEIQSVASSTASYTKKCSPREPAICNKLGVVFFNGDGVKKDLEQAFYNYEKACEYGYAIGCYNLGAMYEKGQGVTTNIVKATTSLQKSCSLGYADGCYLLGEFYNEGKNVGQDDKKAFEYFKTSCEGGIAKGCHNLSVYYLKGEVVKKASARAAQLLQQTCEEGMGRSCGLLGGLYLYGEGVTKDEKKAARLEKKACDLDSSLC